MRILAILLFFFLPTAAVADNIVKWCSDSSDAVRYASDNLEIDGFHRCGKLHTQKTCDAEGKRFISAGGGTKSPYGYLDCSKGPRIHIERHLDYEEDLIDYSDFRTGVGGADNKLDKALVEHKDFRSGEGYSDRKLKSALSSRNEKIKELDGLLDLFNSGSKVKPRGRRSKKKNPHAGVMGGSLEPIFKLRDAVGRFQSGSGDPDAIQKNMDALIDGLDPESRKLLESLGGM